MTKKLSPSPPVGTSSRSFGGERSERSDHNGSPSAVGSFKTTLNPFVPLNDPDNVLQAVVIADSFNSRFMPVTLENPRCLLPLVNTPLIEYTFEFLAVAGVQEIFVFCCAHHQKVIEYLSESKWTQSFSPIRVHTIVSETSMGVGDAMREIDSQSLIRTDFILLSGDIVSNMNLKKLVEDHKARRQRDKNVIMTMVVKEADPNHQIKTVLAETMMVIDPESKELLKYEIGNESNLVELETEVLGAHPVVQFRRDLLDCEIDICSPDVLALFTENFDYQHMRKHFVKGILESDILGKKILIHTISNQYAARVNSLPSYDIISKDVMKRWTFPLVPDSNHFGTTDYTYSRHHIYKESDIVLARSCVLDCNVVVAKGAKIGERTSISNSVIGSNCTIGSGVTLKGVYLWNNVVIEDNCTITNSVLCDGVKILRGVTINKGCVLSYKVVVGPNITLKEYTRLTLKKRESDDEDDEVLGDDVEKTLAYDEEVVGKQGRGYVWEGEDEEDMENAGVQLFLDRHEEEDDGNSSDSSVEEDQAYEADSEKFHREAVETVKRSIEERHTIDNTALEINALKFAYNTSFKDCYHAILIAMLDLVDCANPAAKLKEIMKIWTKLLRRFMPNKEDQYEAILIIQEYTLAHDHILKFFQPVLQLLYDADVLEEVVIMKWFKSSDAPKELKEKAQKFIDWLNEASEESDDD